MHSLLSFFLRQSLWFRLSDTLCLLLAFWPVTSLLPGTALFGSMAFAIVLAVFLPMRGICLEQCLVFPFWAFRYQLKLIGLYLFGLTSLILVLQVCSWALCLALIFSYLIALFVLPLGSTLVRVLFSHAFSLPQKVLVFDLCGKGEDFVGVLGRHPEWACKPLALWTIGTSADMGIFAEKRALYGDHLCLLLAERAPERVLQAARKHFSQVFVLAWEEGGLASRFAMEAQRQGCMPKTCAQNPWGMIGKRVMDIVLGSLLCVLFVPVFVLIGLAIRLESPGPVFYRHTRLGRFGREIRMLKFRTMVSNADTVLTELLARDEKQKQAWEADHKLLRDPRITRVGSLLRKFSLDELPQLVKIVCGQMSLVGPRPIVQEEIDKYGEIFAEYCQVRPGLTGLWQVSGRNKTSYEERVAYDHSYITNWSPALDIWILVRTLPVVVAGDGAY